MEAADAPRRLEQWEGLFVLWVVTEEVPVRYGAATAAEGRRSDMQSAAPRGGEERGEERGG